MQTRRGAAAFLADSSGKTEVVEPVLVHPEVVAELEEEIRVTVLHELGHYFGMDEDRLDDLGFS